MSCNHMSGARLYALIGDGILDIPDDIIDKLERMLVKRGIRYPLFGEVTPLRRVQPIDPQSECDTMRPDVPVPSTACLTREHPSHGRHYALESILEILHAAHESKHDGANAELLGERLVEGLIIAAREIVKATDPAKDPPHP